MIDDTLEEEESSSQFLDIDFPENFTHILKDKWVDSCNEDLSLIQQCLILQKGHYNKDFCDSSVNENLETSSETLSNKSIYTFIWKEGGNEAKITGSFSDWKKQYPMEKDPNDNIFKISIPLNNEIYQYKFIVDGEWKCSSDEPTVLDSQGNRNNILDFTKNSQKVINQSKEENKRKKNTEFGNKIPTSEEMKGIVPESENNHSQKHKPFILGLRTKQNKIGEKKYVKKFDKDPNSLEKSFNPLFRESHINIDHMILETENKKNKKTKESHIKNKINKTGVTFRFREKACTIIYYKSQ